MSLTIRRYDGCETRVKLYCRMNDIMLQCRSNFVCYSAFLMPFHALYETYTGWLMNYEKRQPDAQC